MSHKDLYSIFRKDVGELKKLLKELALALDLL